MIVSQSATDNQFTTTSFLENTEPPQEGDRRKLNGRNFSLQQLVKLRIEKSIHEIRFHSDNMDGIVFSWDLLFQLSHQI